MSPRPSPQFASWVVSWEKDSGRIHFCLTFLEVTQPWRAPRLAKKGINSKKISGVGRIVLVISRVLFRFEFDCQYDSSLLICIWLIVLVILFHAEWMTRIFFVSLPSPLLDMNGRVPKAVHCCQFDQASWLWEKSLFWWRSCFMASAIHTLLWLSCPRRSS